MVRPRALLGALAVLATATSLAACGGDEAAGPRIQLARSPYMGVTCAGRPNWIGCDRVGLFVWLKRDVARLHASIEGRRVSMRRVHSGEPSEQSWEGFLQPAGLIDGPLKVHPDRGRYYWLGKTPMSGRVKLTVYDDEGDSATRTLRISLAAGYG
jgi:hypothetical protein